MTPLALGLSLLLLGHPALERMAVIPVLRTSGTRLKGASLLRVIDKKLQNRPEIRRVPEDALPPTLKGALLQCDQDPACAGPLLTQAGVQWGLVVVVDTDLRPPLLSLLLYRARPPTLEEALGDVRGGAGVLTELARESKALFDRVGFRAWSQLTIRVRPDAHIRLSNGLEKDLERGRPLKLQLLPGPYTLEAEAPGYVSKAADTTLVSGKHSQLSLSLDPIEEKAWVESPWFWVIAGAITAGTIATLIVATAPDDRACFSSLSGSSCAGD